MKKLVLALFFAFLFVPICAQVGINTSNPTTDLDVNGTMRVRGTKSTEDRPMQAVKILGLDKDGKFVEVDLDTNLYLDDNVIRYNNRQEPVYNRTPFTDAILNDVVGIIWPGGAGNNRSVIKITSTVGDIEITGIDVSGFATPLDAHGYTVTLYSVDGKIKFNDEDTNSQPANRFILSNGSVDVKQYDHVKLMYDGELERWMVVSRH